MRSGSSSYLVPFVHQIGDGSFRHGLIFLSLIWSKQKYMMCICHRYPRISVYFSEWINLKTRQSENANPRLGDKEHNDEISTNNNFPATAENGILSLLLKFEANRYRETSANRQTNTYRIYPRIGRHSV